MFANKVIFAGDTLIDLTADTVTEESLIRGYTAHKADGTVITGTAFADYPDEWNFYDDLQDSDGNSIYDSSGDTLEGKTVYRKA